MTDLGTLGGFFSDSAGINERGQVIGISLTTSDEFHVFLWQRGVMTDLVTLGVSSSRAIAINERGQVIGFVSDAAGHPLAVLWMRVKPNDHRGDQIGR